MKITRLLLSRYGHFEEAALDFDPAIGLHIVLGANEAGKSTALAAIGDALFGFPHRTSFAYRHKEKDLRIGIGLAAADGRSGVFVRRKGKKDTLFDEADVTVPETAIAAFLAGAGRARFEDMFGMDGAELRRGGTAILDGKGEVGASIVQAYAGPHNVRGALEKLNEEALKLYGDKRGGRAFHLAADAFRAARQDMDDRSVRPTAYKAAAEERDACRKARAEMSEAILRQEAERARLDRIRRTAQPRAALARYRAERAALGDVPDLPADAAARRAGAMQDREFLRREIARQQDALQTDRASLETLVLDEAILAEAAAIDSLVADLKRIESAAGDRSRQGQAAERAKARVADAGMRLGLALEPQALVARMPNDLARAEASRAIEAGNLLAARRAQLQTDWERASEGAEEARRSLAAIAAPAPEEALAEAIEAARAEGRIDDELAKAELAAADAQTALARAIASVPFWHQGAEALASAPFPLATAIEAAGKALTQAGTAEAEARRAMNEIEQRLQTLAADLAGVLAGGTPPTPAAIEAARSARDRAWQLIRRHSIDGGAPPSPQEAAGLPAPLAEGLADLMAQADMLADRRAAEAERIAAYEQAKAQEARLTVQRGLARAALQTAREQHAEAAAAWAELWRPAGIAPADPAAMREWLVRRDAALAALRDASGKEAAREAVRRRHEAVRTNLAAATGEHPGGQLAPKLRAAERRRAQLDEAWLRHKEAQRSLAEAQRALDSLQRKRATLAQEAEAWQAGWASRAASIGLPEGATAELGADALTVWAELERHARDWREARERIGEMTEAIDMFEQLLATTEATTGPAACGETLGARVRHLAQRLAAARKIVEQRNDLVAATQKRATALRTSETTLAKADDTLAALRTLAGVESDEGLVESIARAATAKELDRRIAERSAELRLLDDGRSLEALAREAEGEPMESLPDRLAEIDRSLKTLHEDIEAVLGRLGRAETELRAMERGHDAAEAAQRMQDAAAAAQEVAARYVRLRLGHVLLRAGIDRFRREQQAPLLARAGTVFAALTGGRYERLATDETEDGKLVVVALRTDGTHCPAERLSEGARDQLYLSLRLAAIGLHAAHVEPLPFIADDLLASFDDARARAALGVLAGFGRVTQTILFTHHAHIAAMAESATMRVHRLA